MHGYKKQRIMDIKDTLTLSDIQKEVDDWIKEFGVRYFNELTKNPNFL